MALAFKMGALALKTLAKPLASRFEKWAMGHEVARKQIIAAAQVCGGLLPSGLPLHSVCRGLALGGSN